MIPPVRPTGARASDRRGLALLVIVFAIVIVAAVVSVGYLAADQQFRVGVGGRQGTAAFYAAEAGLAAGLSRWDSSIAALQPGVTQRLLSGRLSSGAFDVRLTRLDAGLEEGLAYYLLVSTGRAHGAWGGRREVALFLRAPRPDGLCCAAALTTRGDLSVTDAGVVSGFDLVPETWAATTGICEAESKSPGPGVVFYGEGALSEMPGGALVGRPATQRRTGGRPGLISLADAWLADLAGLADHKFPGGAVLHRIEPAVRSAGTCDRDAAWNWGAPAFPGHPCFDYLPLIYSEGDLHVASPSSGQGVLLVEGDLEIENGFEFFGIVVVRGSLRIRGRGSRVLGAVIVLDTDLEGSEVTSGGRIDRANCPLSRALRGPKLYLPHPLAEFAWLEILE